jgi:hypothetical protein
MLYNVLQDAVINNRGAILFLVTGEEIELPEEEAAFVIALGYVEAPADPPVARKAKIKNPEEGLEKREER